MTSKATATTAEATKAAASTTNPSSSSSNRYATWLDQRTTDQQQSSESNDYQSPHRIPIDRHRTNRNNNNLNTDNNDKNNNTKSRYIFLPFSLSWRNKKRNHNVEDEVERRRGGVRVGYGGNGGVGVYEPLPIMRHAATHIDGEEMEIFIWNSIERSRRQRHMEYYHHKMERFYNHDGHHPYTIFFVMCFIYWYTYIFDLLATLFWGSYAIILWYHEIFDSKADVNADTSKSSSYHPSNNETTNVDSDMKPASRLYIIVISTMFTLWSIRKLTAMIGLRNIDNSKDEEDCNNDDRLAYSRYCFRRNRYRRSCRCCCRRWGLYVTSTIISRVTILLYITFLFIITWIRCSDDNDIDLLSSKYLIPYFHHHRLYIPSFILRHVVYPILQPYEVITPYDYSSDTTTILRTLRRFIIIMNIFGSLSL